MPQWSMPQWNGGQKRSAKRYRPADQPARQERTQLTHQQVLSTLWQNGVRDIYADLFGVSWPGRWSAWQEPRWLYHDGYHFNAAGQRELRRRFGVWLGEEVARGGAFDVLISDSLFYTHDDIRGMSRARQDNAEIRRMGFRTTIMRCGKGFVRSGGYARAILEALEYGELTMRTNARVLIMTCGNDLWCDTDSEPLYEQEVLSSHIQWVRQVLAPWTQNVEMVAVIDPYRDWSI